MGDSARPPLFPTPTFSRSPPFPPQSGRPGVRACRVRTGREPRLLTAWFAKRVVVMGVGGGFRAPRPPVSWALLRGRQPNAPYRVAPRITKGSLFLRPRLRRRFPRDRWPPLLAGPPACHPPPRRSATSLSRVGPSCGRQRDGRARVRPCVGAGVFPPRAGAPGLPVLSPKQQPQQWLRRVRGGGGDPGARLGWGSPFRCCRAEVRVPPLQTHVESPDTPRPGVLQEGVAHRPPLGSELLQKRVMERRIFHGYRFPGSCCITAVRTRHSVVKARVRSGLGS